VELQKENDFLTSRLESLSKEVVRLSQFRELESTYQQKFTYYEALVEDIMAENTILILD
jgi:hypothetical protein